MDDTLDPVPAADELRQQELRRAAKADDAEAERRAEDNPMWSEYLGRRAAWRRRLANDL